MAFGPASVRRFQLSRPVGTRFLNGRGARLVGGTKALDADLTMGQPPEKMEMFMMEKSWEISGDHGVGTSTMDGVNGKIIYKYGSFSIAMVGCQTVWQF